MANGTYKLSEQPGYNRQLAMAIGEVRDIAEAARESAMASGGGGLTVTETSPGSGLYRFESTTLTATETATGSGLYYL